MKANATRSKDSENALMAPVASKVAESMIAILQLVGVNRIECRKLRSSEYERIIADVKFFDAAPEDIRRVGILIKDSIADILAAVGIIAVEITEEEGDKEMLSKGYNTLLERLSKKEPSDISVKDVEVQIPKLEEEKK